MYIISSEIHPVITCQEYIRSVLFASINISRASSDTYESQTIHLSIPFFLLSPLILVSPLVVPNSYRSFKVMSQLPIICID